MIQSAVLQTMIMGKNELSTESLTVLCMRRYLSSDAKKLINRNGEKLIV